MGITGLSTLAYNNWSAEEPGRFFIDNSTLSDVKQKKYYFKTTVTFRRKFKKTKPNSLLFLQSLTGISKTESGKSFFGDTSQENIEPSTSHDMNVKFDVSWSAVNSTGIKLEAVIVDKVDYISKNSPSSLF